MSTRRSSSSSMHRITGWETMDRTPSGCLWCLNGTRGWHREGEDRTLTLSTFDPNVAAMHLDDLARRIEADSGTRDAGSSAGPEESVESLAEFVLGDPDAPIAHRAIDHAALLRDANLD